MNRSRDPKEVLLLIPCCGRKDGTGPRPALTSPPLHEQFSGQSIALLNEGRRLAFSKRVEAIRIG